MFQVANLKKSFGTRILFDEVSFNVDDLSRVGLVGRNGSGKSTLLKIIMGKESADGGEINFPKGYTKGFLEQHIHFSHKTAADEVASALPEHRKYDKWYAEKILHGLGFDQSMVSKDPSLFSGGFQIRINLAKTLVSGPSLLILDEPTNYLDILSLRWLKSFLTQYPGDVVLVTHDRDFMDSVVTDVMGIHRGKLRKYKGKTQNYYEQILVEEEVYEKTRINQERNRKQLETFVSKFRAKARQASLAQSRMKMLEKMDVKDKLSSQRVLDFEFPYLECPAKFIAEIQNLSFGYDRNNVLFKNLNFSIGRHDRIGVIGKNGKGKSTLLNILASDLVPLFGDIQFHHKVEIGHLGQTNINRLGLENTVEQEIMSVSREISSQNARSIAGTMMFEGDDSQKKIRILSGGERSRVMLGKILAKQTNLLLLDEPTNHLDQESVEGLVEGLEEYQGAILLVTHSEYLLNNVVNKLLVFNREGCTYFEGTYQDFLNKIGWEEEGQAQPAVAKSKIGKKELTRLRQEIIQEKSKQTKDLKKSIEQLESKINTLESSINEWQEELISASMNSEGEKITKLSMNISNSKKEVETLFENLVENSEKLQMIDDEFSKRLLSLEE